MSIYEKMKRQPAVEDRMPKIGHAVSEHVTSCGNDRTLLVIRLPGIPFESATDSILENRFDSLNRFLSSLGAIKGNRLSITTTLKRRRMAHDQTYAFRSSFMKDFSEQYLARFKKTDYFENTYYLSVVLKHDHLGEGVAEIEELGATIVKALSAYDPEILCAYERNGVMFSETFEFIGELINGVERRVPVTEMPGYQAIPNAWMHFGYDVLEVRSDNNTKYAVCYDLKDLPKSGWGQMNSLLTVPVEFPGRGSAMCDDDIHQELVDPSFSRRAFGLSAAAGTPERPSDRTSTRSLSSPNSVVRSQTAPSASNT